MAPKNPSINHQDESYEVIVLESKSEAERRAKLRQTTAGKSKIKSLIKFKKIKKISLKI